MTIQYQEDPKVTLRAQRGWGHLNVLSLRFKKEVTSPVVDYIDKSNESEGYRWWMTPRTSEEGKYVSSTQSVPNFPVNICLKPYLEEK